MKTNEPRNDEPLAEELRRLGDEGLEPPRDLWPEIREELETRKIVRRSPRWVLRAAAAVLLTTSAAMAWWLVGEPAPRLLEELVVQRSSGDLPATISPELRQAFDEYLAERQRLLDLVGRELESYPPEVRADVLTSIERIEDAMREIETSIGALSERGGEGRLAILYERELRLLRSVGARLGGSTRNGGEAR